MGSTYTVTRFRRAGCLSTIRPPGTLIVTQPVDADKTGTVTIKVSKEGNDKEVIINVTVIKAGTPISLMIYEVYGGGGNSGAPYKNDYVVLYNATSSSISLRAIPIRFCYWINLEQQG